MSERTGVVPGAGMSDRAAVAMLTLQLRTAERELVEVEIATRQVDEAAAREQLRAKLEPLEAQRRAALDEAYEAHRRTVAAAVSAARERAVSAVVASAAVVAAEPADGAVVHGVEADVDGTATDEAAPDEAAPDEAAPDEAAPDETVPDEAAIATLAAATLEQPATSEESSVPTESLVPDAVVPAGAVFAPPTASTLQPAPTTVMIDAEAFARVFATVIAESMDRRWSDGRGPAPTAPPAPPSPSFWSHARHPDVILLGVATVIVLVVLFAWLA